MSRWLRLRANSAPKDPDSGRPLVEPTSANSPARGFGYGPQLTVPRAPLPGSHPSTATAAAAVAAVSLGTGPAAPRAPSSSPHRRQRNAERDHRDFQHHHRERHLRNTPRDSRDPRPRKPNLSNLPNPHQPSSDRNLAPPPINRSHLRSASQPFPALVDGRHGLNNNVDVPIGRQGYLDHDINVAYFSPVSRPPPPSVPPKTGSAPRAPGGHGVPDGQITRKCMTCGHHNSFPGGNKGFGCSSCGMINNLEPNRDKTVPGPAGAVKQLAFPGGLCPVFLGCSVLTRQCFPSRLSARRRLSTSAWTHIFVHFSWHPTCPLRPMHLHQSGVVLWSHDIGGVDLTILFG